MRQNVSLFCEYSCPAGSWRQQLWFISNAKSYRVWSQGDEDPKRALLKHSHQPLTWRRMVADIQELEDVGLGGDLLGDIDVTGVGDLETALLKLAWCKFDGPGDAQLKFLLELQDSTLALLATGLGDFCVPEVLQAIGEVVDIADEYFVPTSLMEQGLLESASILDQGPEVWVEAMREWASLHEPPGPSVSEVSALLTAKQLVSLIQGPSPDDPKAVAVLMENWLRVDPKPVTHGHICGIGTNSTAVFLHWLVARVGPAGYQELNASNRHLARRFAEEFLAHANHNILYYKTSSGGGGIGAAMRSALAQNWESLKERVLGSSNASCEAE